MGKEIHSYHIATSLRGQGRLDHLWQTGPLNLLEMITTMPLTRSNLTKCITFPVMKVSVDFLRSNEEVDHLPKGELKIHLLEVAQLPNELVPLGSS